MLGVVAYTPNGLPTGREADGTGHGLRGAGELGIPVVDVSPATPAADNRPHSIKRRTRCARRAGAGRQGSELHTPCPAHDSSPETLALRGRRR